MSKIIAGRFEQQAQVQQTIAALLQAGFREDQISSFYVNPPGVHGHSPIEHSGNHVNKDESSSDMAAGAATGAVIGAAAGLASFPFLEPVTAAFGTLVGAHIGSLIGALSKAHDDGAIDEASLSHARKAGMMVAATVLETEKESIVFDILQAQGAAEIESVQGTIVNGDWQDFDPTSSFLTVKH